MKNALKLVLVFVDILKRGVYICECVCTYEYVFVFKWFHWYSLAAFPSHKNSI